MIHIYFVLHVIWIIATFYLLSWQVSTGKSPWGQYIRSTTLDYIFDHICIPTLGQQYSTRLGYICNFFVATLPKTNSSPLKIGHPKRKLVFQPSIFRCHVSFREGSYYGDALFFYPQWTRLNIPRCFHVFFVPVVRWSSLLQLSSLSFFGSVGICQRMASRS